MRTFALGDIVVDARSGFASGEDVDDGIVQVRMNNVTTDGKFDWTKLRRVPHPKKIDQLILQPNDILFNATNSPDLVGKNAVFFHFQEPVTFSNHFIRLRIDEDLADSRLVSRWLTDQWQNGKFKSMCRQWVNQASLNKDQLLSLDITLPSLDEQRRIAAILDQADDLRSKRREALTRLSSLSESLFLDMFGDWSRSGFNRPLVQIGDKLDFLTSGSRGWGSRYREMGSLFLRIQNVKRDELDLTDVAFVDPPRTAEARRTKVRAGDVLLSITADLGRTAVVPETIEEGFINQHLSILRSSEFEPRYLSAALASRAGQVAIQKKNREGVKAGLNFDDIRTLTIPDADIAEQRTFATHASEIDRIKTLHRAHLSKLDALFTSLQHRAFNGDL